MRFSLVSTELFLVIIKGHQHLLFIGAKILLYEAATTIRYAKSLSSQQLAESSLNGAPLLFSWLRSFR
jgi:hypothetical protein